MVLKNVFLYIDASLRLGFLNVAYVAWYRFTLKSGIRKIFFPQCSFTETTPFFRAGRRCVGSPDELKRALLEDADKIIQGQLRYFAHHWKTVGNPPDWFLNPFNGQCWLNPRRHWTALGDFNGGIGDIKNVWEASRFEWAVTLARAYAVSGKAVYLDTLNHWLSDWAENNPVNTGPNWKCGQEASIRVFNLMQAALILDQWDQPSPSLKDFIYRHLERISANIRYAIAQDNNHGTSEAAALFIGGHWCLLTGSVGSRRKRCGDFSRQGRKWLENRIDKLVEEDGSFSQHSVSYHRVLLDTLIFAEYWRRKLGADRFSDMFYQRAKAAIHWLILLTDDASGNAPNLGANDGAMLLHTHSCDYRDFRPSIQTASVLFHGRKQFADGPWDEPGDWLGLKGNEAEAVDRKKISEVLPGGYVVMIGKDSWGMIRFPMYRFRPGHNDVFHFDLWFRGENICRDAGSYSYNPERASDGAYFKSVKAHNTVGFDDCEQMPRLGRFLSGQWIRAEHVGAIEKASDGSRCWMGSYRDYRGNRHQRKITWKNDEWVIEDTVSGDFDKVEIVYRLVPDVYRIEGNGVAASWGKIDVSGSDCEVAMSEGLESLYYWQKQPVDTLVLRAGKSCEKITTRFVLGKELDEGSLFAPDISIRK
jgi:hypothetical protein